MRQIITFFVALFSLSYLNAGAQFYNITSIPYNPAPFTGISLTGQFGNADDGSTGAIPLPFDFCFFGNTYNECYVGSNGWVSFSPNQPNTFTSNSIPSTLASVPKNCIMAPWQDWWSFLNGNGNIQYATFGTAPFRRFVVTFFQLPLFSCTSLLGTFQVILYECTNEIEVHILEKPPCLNWAGGTAVLGVHNATGTVANTVSGRNSSPWVVVPTSPEGWLFRPVGFCEAESFGGFVSIDTTSRWPVVKADCYTGTIGLKALDGTLNCNSITPDGSDFRLYDPKGNLMQIRAVADNCAGGKSDSLTIFSAQDFLFNGDHYLVVRNGIDGNPLVGDCGTGADAFDTIIVRLSDCYEYNEPIHMRNVSVIPENYAVDLTWSYPVNFDPAFFENYRIYYKDLNADTVKWKLFVDTYDVNDTTLTTSIIDPISQNASFRAFLRLRIYGDIRTPGDSVVNIRLQAADDRLTNGSRGIAQVFWNAYDGWSAPTYEVYLKAEADTGFGQLLATTADTTYIFDKPIELGKYQLRVKTVSSAGDFVAWSNYVPFEMIQREVEVPNVITPNGDGNNDILKVKGIEFFPENTVQLFNRWGQKVWEGINYQNTYSPTDLEAGVYIYKVIIPNERGAEGPLRIIK